MNLESKKQTSQKESLDKSNVQITTVGTNPWNIGYKKWNRLNKPWKRGNRAWTGGNKQGRYNQNQWQRGRKPWFGRKKNWFWKQKTTSKPFVPDRWANWSKTTDKFWRSAENEAVLKPKSIVSKQPSIVSKRWDFYKESRQAYREKRPINNPEWYVTYIRGRSEREVISHKKQYRIFRNEIDNIVSLRSETIEKPKVHKLKSKSIKKVAKLSKEQQRYLIRVHRLQKHYNLHKYQNLSSNFVNIINKRNFYSRLKYPIKYNVSKFYDVYRHHRHLLVNRREWYRRKTKLVQSKLFKLIGQRRLNWKKQILVKNYNLILYKQLVVYAKSLGALKRNVDRIGLLILKYLALKGYRKPNLVNLVLLKIFARIKRKIKRSKGRKSIKTNLIYRYLRLIKQYKHGIRELKLSIITLTRKKAELFKLQRAQKTFGKKVSHLRKSLPQLKRESNKRLKIEFLKDKKTKRYYSMIKLWRSIGKSKKHLIVENRGLSRYADWLKTRFEKNVYRGREPNLWWIRKLQRFNKLYDPEAKIFWRYSRWSREKWKKVTKPWNRVFIRFVHQFPFWWKLSPIVKKRKKQRKMKKVFGFRWLYRHDNPRESAVCRRRKMYQRRKRTLEYLRWKVRASNKILTDVFSRKHHYSRTFNRFLAYQQIKKLGAVKVRESQRSAILNNLNRCNNHLPKLYGEKIIFNDYNSTISPFLLSDSGVTVIRYPRKAYYRRQIANTVSIQNPTNKYTHDLKMWRHDARVYNNHLSVLSDERFIARFKRGLLWKG